MTQLVGKNMVLDMVEWAQGKDFTDVATCLIQLRDLIDATPAAPTLGDALELLAGHVSNMDHEAFFQFAHAMDKAMETHDPKRCAAALAALQKGGAE
jgi:hypothetical protein